MPLPKIIYGANTSERKFNPNAQWNLGDLKDFIDSPGFKDEQPIKYVLFVESGMKDETNTIQTYCTTFNNFLDGYKGCRGADHLQILTVDGIRGQGATHTSIKGRIQEPLDSMKAAKSPVNFAILLLKNRSIPACSSFKDVMDCHASMQSLCMTQAPTFKGAGVGDIRQYMENVMMKANLKFGGGNHTVEFPKQGNTKEHMLKGTLILGADVTHPGSDSLVGCPSIAAVVGLVDSTATKFRGSMRLQRTCKKEVRLEVPSTKIKKP